MSLTPAAEKAAMEAVAQPVIIEAKENRFPNVRGLIRQLDLFAQADGDTKDAIRDASAPSDELIQQGMGFGPGLFFGGGNMGSAKFGPIGPVIRREFDRFNMVAAFLGRDAIFDIAQRNAVKKVYPDPMQQAFFNTVADDFVFTLSTASGKVKFTDTRATQKMMGIERAHQEGFTGEGVTVTVPDTAGQNAHPQVLEDSFESTMAQMKDQNGHGVWCSSCVFGNTRTNRRLSAEVDGTVENRGMAPDADGTGIKCLGYVAGFGRTSDIIAAIDRSIELGADVVSMSLGGPANAKKPENDPYYKPMERLRKAGGIPVVAAGNSGPEKNTIGSPGHLPNVLTVGAFDPRNGKIAEFSSRGPTNFDTIKPDVVAPGVKTDSGIIGVLEGASDQTISRSSPISGTSMATPHVAGLTCLMNQIYSAFLDQGLTTGEIKTMMQELGTEKDNKSGYGAINFDKVEQWVSTEYGIEL